MRLYINSSEAPKVIEALENSPMRDTPEITNVLERMKRCEVLQSRSKKRNPPDEAGR